MTFDHVWADENGEKRLDGTNNTAKRASGWSIEEKLYAVLAASDELHTIHLLNEEFRRICDKARNRQYQQAACLLRAWICKVRLTNNDRLLKFVKILRNWWGEFLNYFK